MPRRAFDFDCVRAAVAGLLLVVVSPGLGQQSTNSFINFETAPVHPIALSPDRSTLVACNLADGRLEAFDVTSAKLVLLGSVPVGIDPVSVRFRNASEAWVVNQISDSISVVDVPTLRVRATIATLDQPADVVFAGSPARAFVSCAPANTVQVFDPATFQVMTNIQLKAERPKALAVSPDGQKVYAAIFESGNATTLVGAKFRNLLFFSNAVSVASGPYGGQNPPPNLGAAFSPPLNPALPTNFPPPPSGIIVRKDGSGRWLDDNTHDWTDFVSSANAGLTQRTAGWDLPDRDLAIIDTGDFSVTYATGLMNACMALEANPVSGQVAVVGTDAINEVRFEPNLKGIFVRVKIALIDPITLAKTLSDLNPHLDYVSRTLPQSERDKSVGDPRGIAWTADGSRAYVAGMGSRNVVMVDANGSRLPLSTIEVGEGPCGLALDEARQRLYVFNRFSSSISVVDVSNGSVIEALSMFDPTPPAVAAGRRSLYDTRRTSGLGQASCASCHIDARMDRLAWDLGNPAGDASSQVVNQQGTLATNVYHPMKGVMLTQTLQDIIGHEPFHWRGDRPDIEAFDATFTNLQAAPAGLTFGEMRTMRDFLASIRFAPNPYRNFDNSLSTNLPLPGFTALGDGSLPAGAPLGAGNAVNGFQVFQDPANFCVTCHTAPTGLGSDSVLQGGTQAPIPLGPNGGHHFPLAVRLEGSLRSKIAQFRNLADRIGMDSTAPESRAGFGFGHDGSVDSLTRFLNGVRVGQDQDVADLIAFLLSVSGSDISQALGPADSSPPAAMGRQITLASNQAPPLFDAMLALARLPAGRVDLIAKGWKDGLARGWVYERDRDIFQSDRRNETNSTESLLGLAGLGTELTFTLVARGSGIRLGVDRDGDGVLDRDELDIGTNPADFLPAPRVIATSSQAAVGSDLTLEAQVPPLPAPLQGLVWRKDGQARNGATNGLLWITNVSFADSGDYSFVLSTAFQSYTSAPVHITVVPLLVTASPVAQSARLGSNIVFTSAVSGQGPLQYQWQFNGQSISNAQGASLVISNVQLPNEGAYQVVVANSYGAVTSAPVSLVVLVNPAVIIPPLSQSVVAGGNATFSLTISGHPPPFGYFLKKASVVLTNYSSTNTSGFLTLFNAQATNAGTYRILVTNAANPSPGLSLDPVTLTILPDSDHDGLPDAWEAAYGLDSNDPTDAQLDSDSDGQTNLQEYIAGTNPIDDKSRFQFERVLLSPERANVVLQFSAISNKTYTVQWRELPGQGQWSRLVDLVALPTNRLVTVTNALAPARRYFRLVTPRSLE